MSAHCEYSHSAAAETYNSTLTSSTSSSSTASLRKKRSNNKRRFTEAQIKSLEFMFETESRLDPTKKSQLATDLGLQPRQVAIWFQNRRARSKSKQLERDYSLLRASYNTFVSQFEALQKENHALVLQLQKLNDLQDQTFCCRELEAANIIKCEAEVKPSPSMERSEQVDDDDNSKKAEYFGVEDETTFLNFADTHTDGSLASPEDWGNLESADELSAQCDGAYIWWDFWS